MGGDLGMPKAVIVGAGIGGLTTALALHQIGWSVCLLERASGVSEVGAGIQISSNGFKVLDALGLGAAVEEAGFEPETFNVRLGQSGFEIAIVPSKEFMRDKFRAPYIQIHRADLVDILLEALQTRVPGAILLNNKVSKVSFNQNGCKVVLENGNTMDADMVVGADGIHSVVREALFGKDDARFTGNIAWRATVRADSVSDFDVPQGPCVWAGAGKHAVTYPIRGGTLLNFVGVVEQDGWEIESWTEQAPKEEALKDFHGWSPLVQHILNQAEVHHRWALFDRAPLSNWTSGSIVLVGDACHPMLPSLAQGACQAIEDAWVLAEHVDRVGDDLSDLPTALEAYEAVRKPRTTKVQNGARKMLRLFHHRNPIIAFFAYTPLWIIGRLAPSMFLRRNAWIYSHDVTHSKGR